MSAMCEHVAVEGWFGGRLCWSRCMADGLVAMGEKVRKCPRHRASTGPFVGNIAAANAALEGEPLSEDEFYRRAK